MLHSDGRRIDPVESGPRRACHPQAWPTLAAGKIDKLLARANAELACDIAELGLGYHAEGLYLIGVLIPIDHALDATQSGAMRVTPIYLIEALTDRTVQKIA